MPDESDKRYGVKITATAREAIRETARFIAVEQRSAQNAAEWLDRIWTCIDGIEFMPMRHLKAEGYDHLPYVVRRAILDNRLILFTVDQSNATVYVVGLRHGARVPRPSDLPNTPLF
jgi:hypothetical protein